MNITSAITTPYENALLRSTEKTNPISSTLPNAGCIAKDARKACQQVLAIANRFFEAVARINEGPLKENRGIYGLNRDTSGTNHNNPDHNHHDPVITPEQASKILAVLAEDEDKK